MSENETSQLEINNEADLWDALKEEDLDVSLLTDYYRSKLWSIWCQEHLVDEALPSEAILMVVDEAKAMLEGCRRPFCPECGSTNLLELRDATAYLKIKSVYLGGQTSLMSDQDPDESVSIMDSTDLVRCDDCSFESEYTDALIQSARLGAPEKGARVAVPFVHVTNCLTGDLTLGARVHVYDSDTEEWTKVIGPDRDTFPMPVSASASDDEIDQALQVVAGQVSEVRQTITGMEGPVESDGEDFQLGELFEAICWSITAEHAKQQQG